MTRAAKIIVGGFLVRAFVGQALFWISWLRLPIAPSLQIGDGFWFFAPDGPEYLRLASEAAAHGLRGIFFLADRTPSHLFVRLLAILVAALGGLASLAILINCAAYALTCAVLVRLTRNPVLLAAVAFSPAAMLFSLQLLKDTLFFCLIVLTIAIFRRWQELWRGGGTRGALLACAAAMLAAVYALAGIRWYFAAIVWGASAIFFVLVSWRVRRRGWALAAGAVLFVLLAQCVRLGSLDMPPQIARLLDPATVFQAKPEAVTKLVGKARRGFDNTPGATTIAAGPSVATTPIPQTVADRLTTGLSATFLPRFLAQPLGLIRVGGSRGFWLFAEVDTIVFDLVLIYVFIHCVRALRKGTVRATPLLVQTILVFAILAGLMSYTVNNFGTLIRLRQMLYAIAVVTPVTLLHRQREENATSVGDRGTKETKRMKKSDPNPGSVIRAVLGLGLLGLSWLVVAPAAEAQLIISEFRVRGPNGANDEFIEIYNNSGADHTVAGGGTGYAVAASDGTARCVIPNGTVIPNRGHYLCVNSVGYSLASYPAGNGTTATGDATYTTDIPDNAGIAMFNTSVAANFTLANRLDAVGSTSEANTTYKEGTGYPALTPFSIDYSFYRDTCGKGGSITTLGPCTISTPKDTNNNAADFVFVDTNGTSAGAGQRLGAPGPENLSSPIQRNASFTVDLLDTCVASSSPPNRVRDFTSDPANNSTFGTLDIRRTVTNNTGGNVTRLRWRVIDLTTFPAPSGFADLRPRTSTAVVVTVDRPPCGSGTSNVTVQGTTLEQPPSQPNGGGFNSSMSSGTVTLGTPLANGATLDLRFLLGIQQTGTFKFFINVEALP